MRIVALGEAMVELSFPTNDTDGLQLGVAGDTLNCAVYLARLLPPAQVSVSYLTILGKDRFSEHILNFMRRHNVRTDFIGRHESRLPGIYAIELDNSGERSFRYWREQSAARLLFDGPAGPEPGCLNGFDIVCLSGISIAIMTDRARARLLAACASLRQSGRLVAMDSNYRPALWRDARTARHWLDRFWGVASLALPSASDEEQLHLNLPEAARLERIAAAGAQEIVLKRGPRGPIFWPTAPHREQDWLPAVDLVDTTGAGDAFNAGYIAARLQGADMLRSGVSGHSLARQVVAHHGAIIPLGNRLHVAG